MNEDNSQIDYEKDSVKQFSTGEGTLSEKILI